MCIEIDLIERRISGERDDGVERVYGYVECECK